MDCSGTPHGLAMATFNEEVCYHFSAIMPIDFDVLICTDHLGRLAEPTRKGGGRVLFWNLTVFALFPLAVQYFEAIVLFATCL